MIIKHVVLRAALAVVCTGTAFAQQQPAPQLPVEAFGTIPTFTNPHVSPDGSHLAAIQSYRGGRWR